MLDLLILEGNDEDKEVEVARRFNTPIILREYDWMPTRMSMVLSE